MKKTYIILCLCLLASSVNLCCQTSIFGEINTLANQNSIIRDWGNQIIIYAEDNSTQGYFHLMTGITNGSTVLTASAPSGVYVKDFKILNDWVYFVGEGKAANTKAHVAIVGAFQIYNVFYSSGVIQYTTLQPTFSSDHSPYSALSLLRTEVYSYDGIVHIMAIGKQTEDLNGILTTAVFDITYPFLSYRTVPSILGDKEGIFFDLALTDNYVVTVAHKGYSYDLFGNGYIMMRPFHRDNNPLASTTGINRYTSDGYIIPNGIMEATGLSGDMFALSYCEPGTTATAQGIGILQVNTSGVILPVLFKHTGNILSNSTYYTFKDMVYNAHSGLLCDLSNANSSGDYLVDVFSSTGIGDSRLSHPNIKFNSLCTFSTIYCAACGNSAASSLGILLQQLPFGGSCATTNNVSMSITYPLLNSDASITVIDGNMSKPKYHYPNIETNQFIVNCSK